MDKGNIVLQTNNLTIGYNGLSRAVASGINLTLNAGELTALVGLNGIGKSTLLRTITGIHKPLQGEIILNNINLYKYTHTQLAAAMSIVLTEALPPSNLTVYELVALGRQPYTNWLGALSADDKKAVSNALEITETEHLARKKHYELSDGQLQKVLIARAFAQDTPLIILDEPTTHLDILHKASLLKLLTKMALEANKCIFYSTHDIDLALQVSTTMAVMALGTVTQDTPENLITNNVFDTLFTNSSIKFNSDKGSFTLLPDV